MKSNRLTAIKGLAIAGVLVLAATGCSTSADQPTGEPSERRAVASVAPSTAVTPSSTASSAFVTATPTPSATPSATAKTSTTPSAAPKKATPTPTPKPTKTTQSAPKKVEKSFNSSEAWSRYAVTASNIRSGPGTGHGSVGVVPAGKKVLVDSTSGTWSHIQYGNVTGWTASKLLAKSAPVAKPAPTKKAPSGTSTKTQTPTKAKDPAKTAPASGGGFKARAQSIMSQYGCGSVPIILNDSRLGSANGAADWNNNTILLKTSMPSYRVQYVVAHECMHMRQGWAYDGNINALQADTNAIWGGSGYTGLERAADCMTRFSGISVTNSQYASSCSGAQATATNRLLSGSRAK